MAKLSKEDLEQALAVFRAGDQSVCVPVCSKFIVNIIEWLLKLETRNAELEKQLDAGDNWAWISR